LLISFLLQVAHLEEELDAKQLIEDENLTEIQKLKGSLEEKTNLITDLQEHIKSQKVGLNRASECCSIDSFHV